MKLRSLLVVVALLLAGPALAQNNRVMFDNGTDTNSVVSATNPLPTMQGAPSNGWAYTPGTGGLTNTTTAATIKAAVASKRNYVTTLQISAGTLGTATEVAIRDGAGGTVLWRGFVGTAGAQMNIRFDVPLIGSVNTLLEAVTLTATTTGGVYVNAQGYTK